MPCRFCNLQGRPIDSKVPGGEGKCPQTACGHRLCNVQKHQQRQRSLRLVPEVRPPVRIRTTDLVSGKLTKIKVKKQF